MGRKNNSSSSQNITITVAIIGLIGTIITAFLATLPNLKPSDFELALIATQTAEVRQTAAAQVLSFNSSSNVTNLPQPSATQDSKIQITETPTVTKLSETSTPQDLTPVATLDVTITSQPTKTPENYSDPVGFVNYYFSLINERRYEDAWAKLSYRYKENFTKRTDGGGYNEYISYWNTVAKVEIAFIEIQSQSDTKAIIYAEILFNYKAGSTETGHVTYKLIKDSTGKSWLFDPN